MAIESFAVMALIILGASVGSFFLYRGIVSNATKISAIQMASSTREFFSELTYDEIDTKLKSDLLKLRSVELNAFHNLIAKSIDAANVNVRIQLDMIKNSILQFNMLQPQFEPQQHNPIIYQRMIMLDQAVADFGKTKDNDLDSIIDTLSDLPNLQTKNYSFNTKSAMTSLTILRDETINLTRITQLCNALGAKIK